MTRLTLAFLAALAATTGTASAATLVGNTIDVEFNHNFARVDYWCAAGAAVISAGEPVDTMIYRTSPAHRSAGEGMSFPIASPEDVRRAWASVGRSDQNTDKLQRNIIRIARKHNWMNGLPKSVHDRIKKGGSGLP